MKIRTVASVASVLVALVAGVILTTLQAQRASPQQQITELESKEKASGLSVKEYALLAKAKGQQRITIRKSHSPTHYAGFKDLDTASAVYTVLIARPVARTSYLNEDGFIVSSYKFKTSEVLSERPPSDYTFRGELRPELLPLDEGEFVVTMRGGTAVVDGVEVTMSYDGYEQFSLSNSYLLFLDFDRSKKVGGMDMGPLSALVINDDGTLETLDKQPHPIKRAVDTQDGNSVERLKERLRAREGK